MAANTDVLTDSHEPENQQNYSSAKPMVAQDSQALNICSFPKNYSSYSENINTENHLNDAYAERCTLMQHHIQTETYKAIQITYKKEYTAWRLGKSRSKKMKGIPDPVWGSELDTFIGFLNVLNPAPAPDYSLDRIDPNLGYVVGNVRWANKQLQSDNRRNVEVYDIRGVPMTLHQLSRFLGIAYGALRMRINRGGNIEDIVAEFIKLDVPPTKTRKKSLAECPWTQDKEAAWEAKFKLKNPDAKKHTWNSRSTFYVNECELEFAYYDNQMVRYKSINASVEEIPEKFMQLWTYCREQLMFAQRQAKRVVAEHNACGKFSIAPTQAELAATKPFQGYFVPVHENEGGEDDDDDDDDDDNEVIEHEDSYRLRYGNDCNDDE